MSRIEHSLREAADTEKVTAAALRDFSDRHPNLKLNRLTVVIAAYEEADNIGPVLDEIPADIAGLAVSVLVIDDGSSDATAEHAESHGAYVCRLPVNRGHGVALRLGYRIAREHDGDYIATLDADGQWDPGDLPDMVTILERDEADLVIGSRRLGRTENSDRLRNVGVIFFAWLIGRLTHLKLTDTSSGLRAMRSSLTGAVTQTQPQYQTSELLIGALLAGYRVAEVPTVMRQRFSGESKKGHNVLYGFRYLRVILKTWLRERGRRASAKTSAGRETAN